MSRALAVDAGTVLLGGVAICLWADRLWVMTALVPVLMAVRLGLWGALVPGVRLGREAALLAVCTVLGGFNDWNSVVYRGIYTYTVPVFAPEWTTIPVWMLLFWGLILRLMLTVASEGAGPIEDRIAGRAVPPVAKVVALLALVFVTRQCIYAWYADPVWSWLPFLGAAILYAILFGVDAHDRRLVVVAIVGGTVAESVLIHVGGLHRYALGWLGGVPLWIALWWAIAVLVWKDLGRRLERGMGATDSRGTANA